MRRCQLQSTMDPISVAASIVGLLGAAASVSSLLVTLIDTAKGAPRLAKSVLLEVNAISVCLTQLQEFLVESRAHPRSRRRLVLIEQIVVTLTACMMTFADLEKIASTMQENRPLLGSIRIRWALKEKTISRLLAQLQNSKASLNFMLAILTCTSFEEAQSSVTQLTTLVEQLLGKNEEISRRLETFEIHPGKEKNLISFESENADDIEGRQGNSVETVVMNTSPSSSFEQDLYASPVYARTMEEKSNLSIPLSTGHSNARSFLSNLSLADVSDISVLSLPITTAEIWNHHHYLTEHQRVTKTHASPRDSRVAMSQHHSVPLAEAELPTPLDKIPDACISGEKGSSCVPNKIMLLGISLAGKTTVLKQLQNLYAGGFTPADRVEARAAILRSLICAFQGAWNKIRYQEDDFEDDAERLLNHFEVINYFRTDHQLYDLYDPDLLQALTQLWQHSVVRRTLIFNHWVGLGEDVSHIMTNIDDLLNPNYILSDEEVLRARTQTIGVFKHSIGSKDFEYKFLDIGGVRSERCRWGHHYSQVNHIIFVISLPGYYQYLVEDNEMTQMKEALRTFKTLTQIESLQNTPMILFLNKTDLFMEHLVDIPISNYFLDYDGGSDYHLACQYFAQRFRKLDRRKNGKLFFCLTNAADADSFKQTFRHLRLNVLRDPLALQTS